MTASGAVIRFDCSGGEQFDRIGLFWERMAARYPRDTLRGVGYDWHDGSFAYLIGRLNEDFVPDMSGLDDIGAVEHRTLTLPDAGWQAHECALDDLDTVYDAIWSKGALTWEIEAIGESTARLWIWPAPPR